MQLGVATCQRRAYPVMPPYSLITSFLFFHHTDLFISYNLKILNGGDEQCQHLATIFIGDIPQIKVDRHFPPKMPLGCLWIFLAHIYMLFSKNIHACMVIYLLIFIIYIKYNAFFPLCQHSYTSNLSFQFVFLSCSTIVYTLYED